MPNKTDIVSASPAMPDFADAAALSSARAVLPKEKIGCKFDPFLPSLKEIFYLDRLLSKFV